MASEAINESRDSIIMSQWASMKLRQSKPVLCHIFTGPINITRHFLERQILWLIVKKSIKADPILGPGSILLSVFEDFSIRLRRPNSLLNLSDPGLGTPSLFLPICCSQ